MIYSVDSSNSGCWLESAIFGSDKTDMMITCFAPLELSPSAWESHRQDCGSQQWPIAANVLWQYSSFTNSGCNFGSNPNF